jgi:beta-lactam-binding protein with PASTA domain/tRNA A-37 threonylcarbamoyl transferase component Bud32
MPELDDKVLIDGRYRILHHVGSGGMADVYCAEDIHLGRRVAVKLLYRRFAQDSEFVERFRREASAAAALQHPNVVNVYDRGEFDGTYYIAMEFCEGLSLKELITREAPLPLERAIEIVLHVLVAARFAHRRGIIHRDLKPQNVIIDPDEREDSVKVADFGIARAGASEITEVGAIMGTAHYLSPEQAQGRSVTEASDLYSIGVVLFEMLTGRAPFEGDSAVAIALKHVSQPPPSPRELRPDISPQLEAVLTKALAKDPADRYSDADSFIRDIEHARAALPVTREADGGSTAAFAPVGVVAPPPPPPPPPAVAAAEEISPPPLAIGEPPSGGRRRPLLLALAFLALLAGVVLAAILLTRPDQVRVPVVLGQTLPSARAELEADGFEVDIDRRADQSPVDNVFREVPSAGSKVDKGATVTLFVSNGPTTVKVPDVLGLAEQDARRRVKRANLRPFTERESSRRVPAGNVIRSDPGPGTGIERGSRVTLVVSAGPKQVTVPDVDGQDQNDAVRRLRDANLSVVVRERESSEPVDTVVEQTPAAGQLVGEGTTVTLFVSNGKVEEVPDVVGLAQAEAEAELRSAGFRASVRTRSVSEPDEDGTVLSQSPAGGKERRRGESVTITVGALTPPPAETPPSSPGAPG